MSDRYVVVSADGHAGLPNEGYRDYLPSSLHGAFDAWLAEKEAKRAEALAFNYDYIMGWEPSTAAGLGGAFAAGIRNT
jgi:hypothetical protein